MGIIRPATPGFLITLTATALLAVVSFGVPYFQSVYFLKASVEVNKVQGSVIFGTLGYCMELSNGTSCSKPSIGYELDVNALFGNKIAFAQIPTIAVKWVTYALFLHVVALLLAAVSAFFGLLAHVREMSMTCFSTCISGFAAAAAMFAFVIDLVFFFLAKARINKVPNGKAEIGLAIWLTLAAWVMLFFSGCFFAVGRCCVSRRPRGPSKADKYAPTGNNNNHNNGYNGNVGNINNNGTEEALRMQAIKTEADRKQNQVNENGLPAFHEYSRAKPAETQPLTALVDGNEVYVDEEATPQKYAGQPQAQQYSGGYVPAAAGNRAVEQLNEGARRQPSTQPSYPPQPTYPPQPQQSTYAAPAQPSGLHAQGVSGQASSLYNPAVPGGYGAGASAAVVAGSMAYNNRSQNLSPGPQQGHQQYPSGALYGHGQDKTSYHSASSHHQQPSSYSQYDPYAAQQPQSQPQPQGYSAANQSLYNTPSYDQPMASAAGAYGQLNYGNTHNGYGNAQIPYQTSPPPMQPPPERSYTVGGNGYGANVVPALHDPHSAASSPGPGYMPYPGEMKPMSPVLPVPSPPMMNIATGGYSPAQPQQAASGSRMVSSPTGMNFADSPPGYDGPSHAAPNAGWDVKR